MSTGMTEFCDEIQQAHDDLGHTLGWRFLGSKPETLSPDTRLALFALNPGESTYHPPIPYNANGNMYRVETWWPKHQRAGLQRQVQLLYAGIAAQLGADRDTFMDESLVSNFCPFRSRSWATLVNPRESIAFSERLWARVLTLVHPDVIVCLGSPAMKHMSPIVSSLHGNYREDGHPVNWEGRTYTVRHYPSVMMLGLPHLSQYKIFGREESRQATEAIVSTIAMEMRRQG
jgi:uracil-DNA glycosylase